MNGLTICREYYQQYGQKLLAAFPALQGRVAAGLVGEGSECFGFDDEISRDHDFFPRFMIWLTDEDYEKYGQALQSAYQELPSEYKGYSKGKTQVTAAAASREGVMRISDFYKMLLGRSDVPELMYDWIGLQETRLATVTNGEVFEDQLGLFTSIREGFRKGFPEDVRLKKMAARLRKMAQAGQYQYSRCMRHGEKVAAFCAEQEFIMNTMSFMYLANQRFMPFYKWMFRASDTLAELKDIRTDLEELVSLPEQSAHWNLADPLQYQYTLNWADEKVACIEHISAKVVAYLQRQGFSDLEDTYLEVHAAKLEEHIQDQILRQANLMS